jgi:hypothetical protein
MLTLQRPAVNFVLVAPVLKKFPAERPARNLAHCSKPTRR